MTDRQTDRSTRVGHLGVDISYRHYRQARGVGRQKKKQATAKVEIFKPFSGQSVRETVERNVKRQECRETDMI